jgi:uracil-DNA glycosylase family 4
VLVKVEHEGRRAGPTRSGALGATAIPIPPRTSRTLLAERSLEALNRRIVACRLCPRLVRYRERVAREKVRRFRDARYWGRPVPGFGDPAARLLVVGLAPAAHGGNRTGRIFTGDRSGDFLYRTLYRTGFANQPTSTGADDGLRLFECYITAAVRCAPPHNRPTPSELRRCRPFLLKEMALLDRVRVIVALGEIAFRTCLHALAAQGVPPPVPRPRFRHGQTLALHGGVTLIASYHPSQQNTQTGRLTEAMFRRIFVAAKRYVDGMRA